MSFDEQKKKFLEFGLQSKLVDNHVRIKMDGFLTRDVVDNVRLVLEDNEYRERMVSHNYELCKAFFSYSVLRRKLRALVTNFTGMEDL